MVAMAYKVFPRSSSGEAQSFPMLGWDGYMHTLFKLLLPKRIHERQKV